MDGWDVFCASNLLNVLTLLLTGGRRPLINTSASRQLSVFNRLMKTAFSISDCHWSQMWTMMDTDDHSWMCGDNMQHYLFHARHYILGRPEYFGCFFRVKSPTVRVWGPVVWFRCSLLRSDWLRGYPGHQMKIHVPVTEEQIRCPVAYMVVVEVFC